MLEEGSCEVRLNNGGHKGRNSITDSKKKGSCGVRHCNMVDAKTISRAHSKKIREKC